VKQQQPITNVIGLYALIGFFAAVGLGLLVVKPTMNSAQAKERELAQLDVKIQALKDLAEDTEKLRENYETPDPDTGLTIKKRRDQILSLLPVQTEEERLLSLLSKFADDSEKAILKAFTPETTGVEPGSSMSRYPVSINVIGSFSQIQHFLQKIENSARFIDVKAISMSAGGAGKIGNSPAVDVRINLTAFYQTSKDAKAPNQ
jgi:Tfp pilus assembly protein PilO